MTDQNIRELVFEALDNAVKENGYTHLLTDDPEQVAIDLIVKAPDLNDATAHLMDGVHTLKDTSADDVTFRRIVNAVTDYQTANTE